MLEPLLFPHPPQHNRTYRALTLCPSDLRGGDLVLMLGDLTGEHPEDGSLFLISPHCRQSKRACDRSSRFFFLLVALVGAGRMSRAQGGTICQNISGLNTRVNSLTSCKHVGGRRARGENIYNKLEFLITHIKRLRGNFVFLASQAATVARSVWRVELARAQSG